MLRSTTKAAWLAAISASMLACVTAHPAEYAAKQWGCPESKIAVKDARATGGGKAYAVSGCGKQMVVECIYRDDAPDQPYECTGRDEKALAAATASAAPAPPPVAPSAPAPVVSAAPSPVVATMAPAAAVDLAAVSHYVATDGRGYAMSDRDAKSLALAASGAFDLSCAKVAPRVLVAEHGEPIYIAEGCGRRASYVVAKSEGPPEIDSFILTGIVSVTARTATPTQ